MPQTLTFPAADGLYTVDVLDAQGRSLLHYAQEILDEANVPTPVELVPHPDTLKTAQELYLHGVHLMQYRHPTVQPETYLEEADEYEYNRSTIGRIWSILQGGSRRGSRFIEK